MAAPDWRAEAASRLQDVIDHADGNGTIANLVGDELRDVVALAGERLRSVNELVVFLVGVAGMQRDTIDQWWTDDWNHEVEIENADWLALLNELIPAGRTF